MTFANTRAGDGDASARHDERNGVAFRGDSDGVITADADRMPTGCRRHNDAARLALQVRRELDSRSKVRRPQCATALAFVVPNTSGTGVTCAVAGCERCPKKAPVSARVETVMAAIPSSRRLAQGRLATRAMPR